MSENVVNIELDTIIDSKDMTSVAFDDELSIDFIVRMGLSRLAKLIDYAGSEYTLGSMGTSTLEDLTYITV